jgi:eukaryotic-like serine/threonine-protein kinase
VADRAVAQNMGRSVHLTLFELAFLGGDEAAQQHEVDSFPGTFEQTVLLFFEGSAACALGEAQKARTGFAQSLAATERLGLKELGGGFRVGIAGCEAVLGDMSEARQKLSEALAYSQDRDTRSGAMVVLAQVGDTAKAQKLAEDLVREYPEDTLLNKGQVPQEQGFSSLQQNQPAQAVERLEVARPYEFGTGPFGAGYSINFIRAEAYLRMKDGAKAVAEYQKILDHRGTSPLDPSYNLSHLGLGRAYALQNDTAHAKAAYQDFFAAWKDADADVPVLKQAKAEYTKLQ